MALGFSPKHLQDIQLGEWNQEHFLLIALESARQLGWNIRLISEKGFIANTGFSMSSWGEEFSIRLEGGVAHARSECTGTQLADWGKNKKNIAAFFAKFNELKDTFTPEEIAQKLAELRQAYVPATEDPLVETASSTKDKVFNFLAIFKPTEGYFVTPILINLNILIFLAMVATGVNILLPDNESLLNWGANFRPLTLEGQSWRLLTSCFLHIGILHLLMNMYALLYVGLQLEPFLGKTRFSAAYLLSGIFASLTSLWWHDLTISAGASGAIFGMYGVFLALLTTNLLDKSVRQTLLSSVAVFVGYNLLFGMKSGIDNAAHIGGLLSGLVIGYAYVPSLKQYKSASLKLSTIGLIAVAVLASSFMVIKTIPNDIGRYDKEMQKFISMESMALEIFSMPQDTPKEKLLSQIQDKGIYYWHENIKLLDSFENFDLPEALRKRNHKLKKYCQLRIKSYELIYKSIEEDSNQYEKEIIEYNQRIEKTIQELSGN